MEDGIRHQAVCEWTRIAASRPTPPRTRGNCVGDVLPGLMTRLGLEQLVQQRLIVEAWPLIVGRDIAARAQPTKFYRGVLTVSVDNAAWRDVLVREHKSTILKKFSLHLKPSPIKDIVFR